MRRRHSPVGATDPRNQFRPAQEQVVDRPNAGIARFENIAAGRTHHHPHAGRAETFGMADMGDEIFRHFDFQHSHGWPLARMDCDDCETCDWNLAREIVLALQEVLQASSAFRIQSLSGTRIPSGRLRATVVRRSCTSKDTFGLEPLTTVSQSASASVGCSQKDDLRGCQGTAQAEWHRAVQGRQGAHLFSFSRLSVSTARGPADYPSAAVLARGCACPPSCTGPAGLANRDQCQPGRCFIARRRGGVPR